MTSLSSIAVIGIGNEYRTDDGVGLYVARQFLNRTTAGVKAVVGIGDGYALLNEWRYADLAWVIDCARSGAEPGTVYRFDALREVIPIHLFPGVSTHSINVNKAIEMARVLNRLPRGLVVYGIEGRDCSAGSTITREVLRGADIVIAQIRQEIESLSLPDRQGVTHNHA